MVGGSPSPNRPLGKTLTEWAQKSGKGQRIFRKQYKSGKVFCLKFLYFLRHLHSDQVPVRQRTLAWKGQEKGREFYGSWRLNTL